MDGEKCLEQLATEAVVQLAIFSSTHELVESAVAGVQVHVLCHSLRG